MEKLIPLSEEYFQTAAFIQMVKSAGGDPSKVMIPPITMIHGGNLDKVKAIVEQYISDLPKKSSKRNRPSRD